MIVVYTNKASKRLDYACRMIFEEHLGLNYRITQNPGETQGADNILINYTSEKVVSAISIHPSGLLEENSVRPREIKVRKREGIPLLFYDEENPFDFDIFSAVFYQLSRYEEYLPFEADEHKRFPANASLAHKKNYLQIPVVDLWIEKLAGILLQRHPEIKLKKKEFSYLSTIDIDNGYAYKGKEIKRFGGALARQMVKGNFEEFKLRFKYISGKLRDPFDFYDEQIELSKKTGNPLLYFVLYANPAQYDRSLKPGTAVFDELIKKLNSEARIGIHPSYASGSNKELTQKEIDDLTYLTGKRIVNSRQHFLKFSLPNTPRLLIDYGITNEYSMGYSTENGFRAGTARSFLFYDLPKEQITKLRMHPFQVMDSVFFDKKKISAEEAWKEIEDIFTAVRKVKGEFISVWHDRSFDDANFAGWKENYKRLQELCKA